MDLYIAEKPDVGKHIASVINPNSQSKQGYIDCGNNQIVTWCIGHLLALADPEDFNEAYSKWNLADLPMQWPVKYKPNPNTKSQLNVVLRLLKKATRIFSCTDIDAAGQAIADEIFEYAGIDKNNVVRILINDNNPSKIAKALEPRHQRPNGEFHGLYLQELSRAVADQRCGYNLTRLLTCQGQSQGYVGKTLNVGRVQAAINGLVVRRERERDSHQKQHYYHINGTFASAGGEIKARFQPDDHHWIELDSKGRIANSQQAQTIARSLHGRPATITEITRKNTSDSPPLPYDLLSLQVDCARYYGMQPDEVLTLTQMLRESPYYAITYNRSDCRYIPEECFAEAPEIIEKLGQLDMFAPLVSQTDTTRKTRAFNSSKTGAHGAITPTGSITGWDRMPDDAKAVFLLIARNYLLQFFENRQRRVTDYAVTVNCDKDIEHRFTGRAQKVIVPGWSSVFCNDADSEEAQLDDLSQLDSELLSEGQTIQHSMVEAKALETKPPASYSITTLLRDLKSTAKYISDPKIKQWMLEKDKGKDEQGGIGTAATRSDILKGLFDTKSLQVTNKKITPTEKGYMLYDLLPSISSPETTAIWSHYFKQINSLDMTPEQFWSEIDRFIESEVARVKKHGLTIPDNMLKQRSAAVGNNAEQAKPLSGTCPKCKSKALRVNGRFGHFWACQNKESCKANFSDLAGQLFYRRCPKCKNDLRISKGKRKNAKPFISCSGFPQCDFKDTI
ncbi:DNA topoisomerase [Vibrio sp.]|uniref:DNA topoisomerase n=1 Tax=Vibrio sp. TaxID=678 RepID=UPI003D0ACA07